MAGDSTIFGEGPRPTATRIVGGADALKDLGPWKNFRLNRLPFVVRPAGNLF
jgi:hypothetical protein